jgi:hypothetical protein
MIDMMRTVHSAYAPASEPFGARLETFFMALCVALGDIDGKLFSVAKIASYMATRRYARRIVELPSFLKHAPRDTKFQISSLEVSIWCWRDL